MLRNCEKGTDKGDTLYCRLAKSSLSQCIRQYKGNYNFLKFWEKHSTQSHVNVSNKNISTVGQNTGLIDFVDEKLK